MGRRRGWEEIALPLPPTSFSSDTYANVGMSSENFLTFHFNLHCVKSLHIWSFSGPYCPYFSKLSSHDQIYNLI